MPFIKLDRDTTPEEWEEYKRLEALKLENNNTTTTKEAAKDSVDETTDEACPARSDNEDEETNSQSTDEEPAEEKDYAPDGSIPEMKNLYQAPPDMYGRINWTARAPDDLAEPPENAESAQYALLIRNERCYDGKNALKIHSLVIQSQRLKTVLGQVLAQYPGISTTELKRLEFLPPFEAFVHRWDRLLKAEETEEDADTKKHLKLLGEVLKKELGEAISDRNDLTTLGVARYDTVWTLFEPGCQVFSTSDGHERVYKFTKGEFRQCQVLGHHYALDCQYVQFDGANFGYKMENLAIPAFNGTIDISKLPVYPIDFHPDQKALTERLIARGRLFEQLKGYHFKSYDGIGVYETPCGPLKHSISGRVILDTHAYNRFNPNFQVRLSKSLAPEVDVKDQDNNNHRRGYPPGFGHARAGAPTTKQKLDIKLTDEHHLTATHELRGYSLKDKKWFVLNISDVKEIAWNEKAFSSLVAPQEQKDLILAFARSQLQNKGTFDDVIQGKGRGIIMLLSGPPGVGKTLTAESVAEVMKTPLYMLSAGDLGTTPSQVEDYLSKILELNAKWNAVLLIDEADVFLEARSSDDLERNKLVSIFLRLLEYYEGILFLTTNRVENIDAAFESRIHLSLQYDDLSTDSRRHVWKTFLARCGEGSDFTEDRINQLAEYKLNGRQIKNVLKAAQLLASDKGALLSFAEVNTVMKIRAANEGKIGNWGGIQK
ncbi:P-loop containing nucleoside triphosphate hydrolase protein [Microthyrium microscopicum]|uniref:P-loop containing nucleoside triphosphate hydrolase protein n=1 Tax=Microthyrium microscopicum TaxID=703497 RepID=A0A6A6TYI2_9PEZI|nr:P-loop containing nucleoside triphosphate hydrolase protein [Microthyrium microscopicum]